MTPVITSVEALEALTPGDGPVCVLHGMGSSGAVHKRAQKLRYLSVGTPLMPGKLHFDVAYHGARALTVDLSERAKAQLRPWLKTTPMKGIKPMFRVEIDPLGVPRPVPAEPQEDPALRLVDLARRGPALAEARALLDLLFEAPAVILSEQDGLPCL